MLIGYNSFQRVITQPGERDMGVGLASGWAGVIRDLPFIYKCVMELKIPLGFFFR